MTPYIHRITGLILLAVLVANCGIKKGLKDFPPIEKYDTIVPLLSYDTDTLKITTQAYLYQNKQKLWELYVQGDPYQIGLQMGALTQKTISKSKKPFFLLK